MGNLDVTLKAGVLKLWGNKRSGNSSSSGSAVAVVVVVALVPWVQKFQSEHAISFAVKLLY